MRSLSTLLIALIVVGVLIAYMFMFTVRYDEVAVLTTFDNAVAPQYTAEGELARDETGALAEPGSLRLQPGPYFKWPWPIQKVYTYSAKVQVLEDRLEEIRTADNKSIVLNTYLTWRIDDPYAFFTRLKSRAEAERQLEPLLRNLRGVISQYNFEDLVNNDPDQLKLDEVEAACTDALREQIATIQPSYGIHVEHVGIRRLIFPQQTTEKVFERMRTTQEALAERARAEGRSVAQSIESSAETTAGRIQAFADSRAAAIRARGDSEKAKYLSVFRENEAFAELLWRLESLEKIFEGQQSTFVLPAETLQMEPLFKQQPPVPGAAGE